MVTSYGAEVITLPAGKLITVDGSVQWSVETAIVISAGTTVSLPAVVKSVGATGNLAGNAKGILFSPLSGVFSLVSDQNGIVGGNEIEFVEGWRDRIIEEIHDPPSGARPLIIRNEPSRLALPM